MAVTKLTTSCVNNVVKSDSMLVGNREYANSQIALAHNGTPFVSVYNWLENNFGSKYANPATLPGGTGNGVVFNAAGTDIAIAHTNTPYITVYPWSNSAGFGTKYSNPATLPTANGLSVAFSNNGNNISVTQGDIAMSFDGGIPTYPFTSGTGFGSKYSNPATLPGGIPYRCCYISCYSKFI